MSTFPDVPAQLRAYLSPRMKYSEPLKTLYDISVDWQRRLLIVGDPNNGCYDWVLLGPDGAVTRHSNDGYGVAAIALRDGLVAYHGLPSAFDELRKRLMSEPPAEASRERVHSHYADLVGDAIKTIDAAEVK